MTNQFVVIAVVNNKGGVGKTTTSVNLGAALAEPRRRVLLVDLDSQASASLWCGVRRRGLRPSSASCLMHQYPVAQAIRKTSTPHLDLIPGSIELANVDVALCNVSGRETTLREMLQSVRGQYQIVVLDCPPSLSLIGVNALVAADVFIVPLTPQILAVEGLVSLLGAVDQVRTRLRSPSRLLGVLLTMVDHRNGTAEIRKRLRARYRDRVFHTEIGSSQELARAPESGQTILTYAPRSAAARDYRSLAGEVLQRLQLTRH